MIEVADSDEAHIEIAVLFGPIQRLGAGIRTCSKLRCRDGRIRENDT